LGSTLTFDRTYLCNRTWYQQSEINYSPACPPNLVNIRNGRELTIGEFLKFSHWETLPALPRGRHITDSRQTLAYVM